MLEVLGAILLIPLLGYLSLKLWAEFVRLLLGQWE